MNEINQEPNQTERAKKRRQTGSHLPLRLAVPDREDTAEQPTLTSDTTAEVGAESSTQHDGELKPARTPQGNDPSTADGEPADALSVDGPVEDHGTGTVESADADVLVDLDLAALEALLFSTHHPLTTARLAELILLKSAVPLRKAIKALNTAYEETGRSFRVEQVAGGYQLLTLPKFGEHLKRLYQKDIDTKLSKSALETLAIIAYKQPMLRADLEAIRGVACGETIRSLMEKHLVRIAGRAEVPGRPILYGTTKRFLELFGLNTLKELPQSDELVPKPQA